MPSTRAHRAKDPDEPVGNHPGAGDGAPPAEGNLGADESLDVVRGRAQTPPCLGNLWRPEVSGIVVAEVPEDRQ